MTEYYLVAEGHTLHHPDGFALCEGGEVVALDTDSKDKFTRKAALAVLSGNWNIIAKVSKPKGKKSKKGTYKTRDMKADDAPAEAPEAPEATEAAEG